MFLAIFFLAAAAAWGVLASTRLEGRFPTLEARLGVGIAFGCALALWSSWVGLLCFGIDAGPRVAACGVGVLFGYELLAGRERRAKLRDELDAAGVSGGACAYACWVGLVLLIGYMTWRHGPITREDGMIVSYGVPEDLWYHMGLVHSFSIGENTAIPRHPLFSGHGLSYPFVPHVLIASLLDLGASELEAFTAVSWLATSAASLLVAALTGAFCPKATWRRRLGAVVIFLCVSGFGWVRLIEWMRTHGATFGDALAELEPATPYFSVLSMLLLPSRGTQLGLTLGLASLFLALRAIDSGKRDRATLLAGGVLAGLLPLVHGHSLIVIACVSASWALLFPRPFWRWLWYFVPFWVIGIPQSLWIRSNIEIEDLFRWEIGWATGASGLLGILTWMSWWAIWGGPLFLIFVAAWLRQTRRVQKLVLPFLLLLALMNLMRTQPVAFENVRTFAYVHIALAILVTGAVERLWQRGRLWVRALIVLVLAASLVAGVLSTVRGAQRMRVLERNDEQELARAVMDNTPPRAIFLASRGLGNPIFVLAGRTLVRGDDSCLQDQGFKWWDRDDDLEEIFERRWPQRGDGTRDPSRVPDAEVRRLIAVYGIDYIVVGPGERAEHRHLDEDGVKAVAFDSFTSNESTIYRVSQPP